MLQMMFATMTKVRHLLARIHRFVKESDPLHHASIEILDFFRRWNRMNGPLDVFSETSLWSKPLIAERALTRSNGGIHGRYSEKQAATF